jgi:hypothetical protein
MFITTPKMRLIIAIGFSSLCFGCAYVPSFDVPNDQYGQPTARTIVDRIKCEILDIVRRDRPDDVDTYHGLFLLNQDYDVEATLSLEVNDTGGLAPTVNSIVPFATAATSLVWGATGTLSGSRDQNFTENLHFNVRDLYNSWKDSKTDVICPPADTHLAGELGIRNIVALADSSPGLDEAQTLGPAKGAFGGSVQFLVTLGISAAGPTWTLTHFKGPGGLGSLSRVDTDKLTIAFAPKADAGPQKLATPRNQRAYEMLLQIQTNAINSQLLILLGPH